MHGYSPVIVGKSGRAKRPQQVNPHCGNQKLILFYNNACRTQSEHGRIGSPCIFPAAWEARFASWPFPVLQTLPSYTDCVRPRFVNFFTISPLFSPYILYAFGVISMWPTASTSVPLPGIPDRSHTQNSRYC